MLRPISFALCLAAAPALAQQDERDFLTAFLEDNLSGAGRQVVVRGFEGTWSSQARMAEMTIADDQGVWLTLRDVVLDWNRAALLSGNLSVNQLSVAEIIVARLPIAEDSTVPQPEAGDFSLPELPVSLDIGQLVADRIELGPDVLGQAVEGRFEASMALSDGEGDADLVLERTDNGPDGRIALEAGYSNASKTLAIDLVMTEGPDGLVANAIGLPGVPSTELQLRGNGPFSAFVADVNLSSDGQSRLAGRVVTQSATGQTGFAANLSGDLAPLFLPDYAEFFGNKIKLVTSGTAHDDGRIDLSRLELVADALNLKGSMELGDDRSPRKFQLQGRIALADGAAVLLPLPTDLPVRVQSADLLVNYDKAQGEDWTARASISGLDRADLQASSLVLSASGRIVPGQFGATLRFDAEGVQPADAALARALGSVLSGDAVLVFSEAEKSLSIPRLVLSGQDYAARATGIRIGGLAEGLEITGKIAADLTDLSRLDALVDMPVSGAANIETSGRLVPLSGAFDLAVKAVGQDMATGQPMLDGVLRGQTQLAADLRRDETGTRVSNGTIRGNGLQATVEGIVSSTASDLSARLDVADLSVLGEGFGGSLQADTRVSGPFEDAHVVASATGKRLRSGNAEVDKLLTGDSRIAADLDLQAGKLRINRASLSNPEVTAEVTGQADGSQQMLDVKAQMRNLGVLLPEFPGALKFSGSVARTASDIRLDLAGKGPGGIDAVVKGTIAADRADLEIRGRAQAALANAFITPRGVSGDVGFDLRLKGPLTVSSLAGRVTLERARLSDPALAFGFSGISARADLTRGQANIAATLPLTTEGKIAVAGSVGLAEPFRAALGLAVQGVTLRDPDLYEAKMRGELKLTGPLLGQPLLAGRIDIDDAELRVPSTGFGGAAGLPELHHAHEPADVRATRGRAGLLADATASARAGGGDLALDILVSAPDRVFVRGRGLDLELGGEVRLKGNLSDVRPAGAFELIRGRIEILGKRFELDEALLQLEGDLVPFLRVQASTESDGIIASVLVEGRADDPEVEFTSIPELPAEEVLAQLLFGQGLENISALQALRLAGAVATLAGKGGGGLVAKLRQGFGLDDLDVKTTSQGEAELTAGKYIGKNLYTEVTVDQDGKSEIHLNLDLNDSVTVRGSAASDGNTGIGVFLEKDY